MQVEPGNGDGDAARTWKWGRGCSSNLERRMMIELERGERAWRQPFVLEISRILSQAQAGGLLLNSMAG